VIPLSKDDRNTIHRLGLAVKAPDDHRTAGEWDSLAIREEGRAVGVVTQRSGGGYLCSLEGRVYEGGGDLGGYHKRRAEGRGETVGVAVEAAYQARERLLSDGRRQREQDRRDKHT
jgi:hypothetical protein